MPTNSQLRAYTEAQATVVEAARDRLDALMSRLDTTDPQAVYDALTALLPGLVDQFGPAMQSIAAEWFEQTVDAPAVLADMVDLGEVESSARWAAAASTGATTAKPGDVAARAAAVMDKYLKNEARATLQLSAHETPGVAYARVLKGNVNCAFCVTLAGRGAEYRTSMTAARGGETTKRPKVNFHDKCDCQVIAIRSESDWPKGYDHAELEAMYYAAREKAGLASLKGGTAGVPRELVPEDDLSILQIMRREYGLK